MPTTNLITRSLGSTDLSSGTGTPDHSANTGSLYTDTSTGITYINTSGTTTGWEQLQKPGYGELYLPTNSATTTTFTATNSWIPLTPSSLSWTFGLSNAFTQSATSSLLVNSNRGGRYLAMASCSLGGASSTTTYDLGISIAGATPSSGSFQSTTVQFLTPADYATININTYVDLNVGNTMSLVIRCISATSSNVTVRQASLIAIKLI